MTVQGISDIGRRRKTNQDRFRFYSCKKYSCAVVCDGMGGAKGGSVASEIASAVFIKTLRSQLASSKTDRITSGNIEKMLTRSVNAANKAVYEKASTNDSLEGMGTTLVAVVETAGKIVAINTGDSRLYVVKNGEMKQITKDHSFVQFLVDTNAITKEQAAVHPQKNILLHVIGVDEETYYDTFFVDDYDTMLLCSDGLYNCVSDADIENILSGDLDGRTKAEILISLANSGGGTDNITAVVCTRT